MNGKRHNLPRKIYIYLKDLARQEQLSLIRILLKNIEILLDQYWLFPPKPYISLFCPKACLTRNFQIGLRCEGTGEKRMEYLRFGAFRYCCI